MASGFFDLFAYWLGWKSSYSQVIISGPFYVEAAQMYVAGPVIGEVFSAGSRAGEIYPGEPQVGEVR